MPPLVGPMSTHDASTEVHLENEAKVIIFMVVFSVLALVAVALRIASKLMRWTRLGGDDILLLAALAQMLAINVLFVFALQRGGFGRHISEVTPEQLVFFKKSYFIAGIIMPTCYATAKLSMLWLLYNIFTFRNFQRLVRILTGVVIAWWVATVFLDTFICYPINARWDPTVHGTCSNKVIQVEYFATPIPWIITDFAILIAPLPAIWTLKISRARQIGLIVLFGFGVATCGVACKRYVTLLEIDDDDLTFSMVEPCIWTMIESSTTIICAALPAATLALRKILPTKKLRRAIEIIEEHFYGWRDKSASWRASEKKGPRVVIEPVESPPADISTRRLDITPI